jgi:hypothetical protein
VTDQVPPLLVAAALCRTLAEILERIDDPSVDAAARTAARELAERLERAVEATDSA